MTILEYTSVLMSLLIVLLGAMTQMSVALDEADIERFFVWIGIASVIASLPVIL
ncbi:hypothetical protein NIES4071_43110 [Calothrix sp. NIES-4071]|nr:hypothetical protein NIES4071_43110 [Calothrix sp. NIES-4071]BAZ58625.1 hypothetical protein NIES4105_43040 [Calothrix sp. NIES-4105]